MVFVARRKIVGVLSALVVFVVVASVNHYLYLSQDGRKPRHSNRKHVTRYY